jgi:lysophospholipase L1-like esterase
LKSPADTGNRFERKPWLGWLVVLAGCLLIGELSLRVLAPEPLRFAKDFREIYRYHQRWYTDFEPNTTTTIRMSDARHGYYLNFLVTINAMGFRWHDRLLDAPVPQASPRKLIHTIGDSFTMGWGVNYEATYPARLQEQLGDNFAIINLGLNGFGTIGATEKSLQLMDALPPAAVVYLVTENDYADDLAAARHMQRPAIVHEALDAWNFLRRHTYLASVPYAVRWWLYFRPGLLAETPIDSAAATATKLETLKFSGRSDPTLGEPSKAAFARYLEVLADRNVPLLVIAHGKGPVSQDFARFSREAGISTRLITMDASMLLRKEGHFNPAGNARLAAYVASWLKDESATANTLFEADAPLLQSR